MRTINIYSLTRMQDGSLLRRYEKQLSRRDYYLPVKSWEIEGLRKLAEHLCKAQSDFDKMNFFYSFQLPRLGKEFDLLQVTKDKVINIELKSGNVTDEKIRKQLLLNRQYLALLGKDIYTYTYVSDEDRLVRLTGSERLAEADFEELLSRLEQENDCITDNIEGLFCEEQYLISPFKDADRFLRGEYFLTAQQRDIRTKILKGIRERILLQGFTGLPGTGKTLLLLDLAMQLSHRQKVCVLYRGNMPAGMERLDVLLKRIDFIKLSDETAPEKLAADYAAVLVDEGHRMPDAFVERLFTCAADNQCSVILSFDSEEVLCEQERETGLTKLLAEKQDFVQYCLTNRIRTNSRLSNFVQSMMKKITGRRKGPFACVETVYCEDEKDCNWAVREYIKKGYTYIATSRTESACEGSVFFADASGMEYDKVVVTIDESFFYDESGYLRSTLQEKGMSRAAMLYHGCNRAKQELAVVVRGNTEVFTEILTILQGKENEK